MSKTEDRGMREVLQDAEGLANVLRLMSGGRLDLRVMLRSGEVDSHTMTWPQAYTEAKAISGMLGKSADRGRPADHDSAAEAAMAGETFCSDCGPLDEPGVHTQRDCPRYVAAADRDWAGDGFGPALWHNSHGCLRCGEKHTSAAAQQLNTKLAADRQPGALAARLGQGGE